MAKKKTKSKGKARKSREPVIVPEKVLGSFSGKGNVVGAEMLELGEVPPQLALIRTARTPKACKAAGGVVRRPAPWMRVPFVCAMPPPWGKGRSESAVPGLLRGTDGASMAGMGAFVNCADRCAPGFEKVQTGHPRWGGGKFCMCVLPPARRPSIFAPGMSGCGMGELFPTAISFPAVILGNLIGLGVATTTPRLMTAFNVSPTVVNVVKIVLGAGGAALFFGTKKSMPLGVALGTVPGAVGAIADFVVGAVTPKKKGSLKGLGQGLEPEDVREIKEVEEALTAALAQRERTVEETTEEELGQVPEEPAEEPTTALPFRTVA